MRSYWPVARVLEVYPRQNGVVRSAKVKLPNTELVAHHLGGGGGGVRMLRLVNAITIKLKCLC